MFDMKKIGLYIHIPFCLRKCNYCDFVSFSDKYGYVDSYFSQLKNEINNLLSSKKDICFDTVYIGGGTPSSVDSKYICEIMSMISDRLCESCEVTIEANPATVDPAKLTDYVSAGINRISIGVQSFSPRILESLGRLHSAESALDAVRLAKNAGFKNINIDLMYGIPAIGKHTEQTLSEWRDTVDIACSLGVNHISAYSLIIEEGTNVYKWGSSYIDDTIDREMFYYCKAKLEENGFEQYEISNFAKTGYESRHNIRYWKCDEYYGVGLCSASYVDGVRYKNTEDFSQYLLGKYADPEETAVLSEEDKMNEFMMLGFRMIEGPSPEDFRHRFGKEYIDVFSDELRYLSEKKLIEKKGKRYVLTLKGLDFANEIFREFV